MAQSADRLVKRILASVGPNTYVVLTSDNGFLLGEHRFYGKDVPYEEALQVPMLMRGPGIPRGVSRPQTVTTVDIAPTIADLANVRPGLMVDGRSMLPMAKSSSAPSYDTVLIQAGTSRQASKPCCAAARARSRSAVPACATLPISAPVDGLKTASVLPSAASRHWPAMKRRVSG